MKSKQKWNRFVKIWLVLGLVMASFSIVGLEVFGETTKRQEKTLCSYCQGTGKKGGVRCPYCQGCGYTYDEYYSYIRGEKSDTKKTQDNEGSPIAYICGCVVIVCFLLAIVAYIIETRKKSHSYARVSNSNSQIGIWTCSNCGSPNTSNTCATCGSPHMSSGTIQYVVGDGTSQNKQWTCSSCGTINRLSNTCITCGNKKGDGAGWRCQCGVINAPYIGTCKCGRSKSDPVPEKEASSQPQVIQEPDKTDEKITDSSNATKFEEIIKYKALLDSGVISQEEFEKKKKELLGL